MHVMLAGQEQNLPSHLLLNSDTSSFVHPFVAAGGAKGEGDDTDSIVTDLGDDQVATPGDQVTGEACVPVCPVPCINQNHI